jgi:general stress protein CsbA
MWTVLVVTFSRGNICQYSGISLVLYIFFVTVIKSYTKILKWPS